MDRPIEVGDQVRFHHKGFFIVGYVRAKGFFKHLVAYNGKEKWFWIKSLRGSDFRPLSD